MTAVLRKGGNLLLGICYSAIAVLVFTSIQIAVGFALAFAGLNLEINDGAYTVCYCVVVISIGFIAAKFTTLYGNPCIIDTRKLGSEALCSALIAFGMLGLVTLFIILIGQLADAGIGNAEEELAEYSESVNRFATVPFEVVPPMDHLLEFIGSAFLVPLAEEITFRGFVFAFFRKKLGPVAAIFASSAIFGAVHGTSIQMVYAFACGVMLAWVYYLTGSIWGSYIVHMLFNLFGGALATLFDSGLFPLPEGFTGNFSYCSALLEVLMIGPGVGAVMYLIMIRKKRLANEPA